tara:strand:- start:350 stop:532 length:183 start_codon:yes stop_codon:yes gene_type:complete
VYAGTLRRGRKKEAILKWEIQESLTFVSQDGQDKNATIPRTGRYTSEIIDHSSPFPGPFP